MNDLKNLVELKLNLVYSWEFHDQTLIHALLLQIYLSPQLDKILKNELLPTNPLFSGYIKYREICSNVEVTKFEDLLVNMSPAVSKIFFLLVVAKNVVF